MTVRETAGVRLVPLIMNTIVGLRSTLRSRYQIEPKWRRFHSSLRLQENKQNDLNLKQKKTQNCQPS